MGATLQEARMSSGWCLVSRCGGYGDNLITSSTFPLLRKKYGKLEVISRAPHSLVFENNPHIDKLVVLPEDEKPVDNLTANREWARRARGHDFAICLSYSCEVSLALFEVQGQFWWPEKARRLLFDKSYLEFVHE